MFVTIAIAMFMSSVDSSIVATALPAMHRSLDASINWAGWTITIYSLGNVIVLPISGRFSDQFGRRRIFLIGIAVFTLSSLLCGTATDIYSLIAFRALQAVGAAAIQPSAAGIIADNFGLNRDRALGLFGTISASGQIAGPIFGGIIVGYLSWRWIFFVNLPLGIIVMSLVITQIPESPYRPSGKVDLRGLALMAICILSANFGITSLGNRRASVEQAPFIVPAASSLVFLYLLARHLRHHPAPFIALKLLRAKAFAEMNALNLMFGVVGFGAAALVPLYAEQRYHFAPLDAGTLLTARGVGSIAVGAMTAFALRRTGYRLPMVVGYSLVAIGELTMSFAPRWGLTPYLWLSVAAGCTGLGSGIANPASRNALMQLAPEDIGAITGLRQMFNNIGIILSASIVTAILNRSSVPGLAQAHIYWAFATILLLVMIPLVRRVPEHKGAW